MTALRSYRDALRRTERRRPDGSPVWPLRDADVPSRLLPPQHNVEAVVLPTPITTVMAGRGL